MKNVVVELAVGFGRAEEVKKKVGRRDRFSRRKSRGGEKDDVLGFYFFPRTLSTASAMAGQDRLEQGKMVSGYAL